MAYIWINVSKMYATLITENKYTCVNGLRCQIIRIGPNELSVSAYRMVIVSSNFINSIIHWAVWNIVF